MSLLFSLYLHEGFLVFKGHLSKEQLRKNQLYKKQTNKKWDTRKKIEIYSDLKETNDKITVTLLPSTLLNKNYSIFPLSGISNFQTIHCNENGYYSIYKSDRYGFNNPDNEWDAKEIEYLLIGDSFTHGACVNRPNDIGSILRGLSKKSVLNLGMTGNGPLLEYVTLREYLDENIKKVLWIYYEGNDFENLEIEKKDVFLVNYLNNLNFTQNLKFKQNEIDKLSSKIINKRAKIQKSYKYKLMAFINFMKIYHTRSLLFPAKLNDAREAPIDTKEFKKILQLTKKLIEKNNSKLYFVYLPEYYRYKSELNNTNYNLVKNIVTRLNITFIDIHKEVFDKKLNPLELFPFEMSGHYNVEGYKEVAKMIYKNTKD